MAQRVEFSKRTIAINSAASLLQPLLGITILLWLNQYLLKRLDPTALAPYYVVQSLLSFTPLIVMILAGGVARFCTEAYARGDDRRMTEIVSTMTPLCALGGLVLVAAGVVTCFFVDRLGIVPEQRADARIQLMLAVFVAAVQISYLPFGVGFKLRQKYMWENLIGLSSDLLRYGLMFALLFGVSTRALWVAVAPIPGQLLALLVKWRISRSLVPALHFERKAMRRDLLKPLLAFQAWNVLARTATLLRGSLTQPLLNALGSASQVIAFRNGSIIENRIFPIALAPLSTVQTALIAFHATGQEDRLRLHYFRYCRYLLWAFLFFFVPFVCYQVEICQAYMGPKYEEYWEAGTVASLLLVKAFFVFNQPVVAQVALAQAKNRALTIRTVVIELTTGIAIWITVGFGGGPIPVALATVAVAALLTPLLHWTLGLELVGARFSEWFRASVLPGCVPTLVVLPLGLAGHHLLRPQGFLQLVPHWLVIVSAYAAMIYFRGLDERERADVHKAFGQLRARFGGTRPAPAE